MRIIPELSAAFIHRSSLEVQIDAGGLAKATGQNGVSVPGLVAAFRTAMEAPEYAQHAHWGATSQDIIDTAAPTVSICLPTLTSTFIRHNLTKQQLTQVAPKRTTCITTCTKLKAAMALLCTTLAVTTTHHPFADPTPITDLYIICVCGTLKPTHCTYCTEMHKITN